MLACGVDIIEHRQQCANQVTDYEVSQLLLFAGGAVLVVGELCLQAKQGSGALRRVPHPPILLLRHPGLSLDGFRSFFGGFDRFSFRVAFRCGALNASSSGSGVMFSCSAMITSSRLRR